MSSPDERASEEELVQSIAEEIRSCGDHESALIVLKRCRGLGLSFQAHARLLETIMGDMCALLSSQLGAAQSG